MNALNKKRLLTPKEPISIISSNCIGGVILSELGLPSATPTINLYFESESYIEFISNLDFYLRKDLEEVIEDTFSYPKGKLGDKVVIHFLHYSDFDSAKKKWDERKQRINWDNMFYILADRDGLTEQDALIFD